MIVEFGEKLKEYEAEMAKFEEERCEQVHSAINQFVVFEKFAEMNNKYDVKNLSDLLETFTVEGEMKHVNEDIAKEVSKRPDVTYTVTDPVYDDRKENERPSGAYIFNDYQCQRDDLKEL